MIEPGRYRLILADPPWSYRNAGRGAAANHYPTMCIRAICDLQIAGLPVADLAHPDSVLILWATNPQIPEALEVCAAWGYTFKTALPWIKTQGPPAVDLFGELDDILRVKGRVAIGCRHVPRIGRGRRRRAKGKRRCKCEVFHWVLLCWMCRPLPSDA